MKKRFATALVTSISLVSLVTGAQTVKNARPDVYLITIDTLRADHIHCYGDEHIQTPALDSLARGGIRFTEAFTPSPLTNTAHTSILTGLLPSVHGVTDFGIPLANTIPTWAVLLQQNGYQTAAFIGAVVLDSRTLAPGLDHGFDFYDNFPEHADPAQHWGRVERRGTDVVRRAETWMNAHAGKPRFVWLHLYDPHDPYEPPPPFAQTYKDHPYDGEIAYADDALGHLLQYLKRANRYNQALIIVLGDHGEGLGEHGEKTHGIFLYDATTHVPLLIKLPALAASPQVITAQIQTTDVLPTVLDLLSIPAPASLANRSLRPYFAGNAKDDRLAFGETDYPLRFGWAPLRAVRSGGFKFIEAPQPELYDLKKDPGELENAYEPWNKSVLQLRKELASSPMRPPGVSVATGAADSKTLDELRALGYLGPGDARTSTNAPELSSLPDPKEKIEEQNLLHTAMMAADDGNAQGARSALEKVLAQDPESFAALRQLGELAFKANDYQKAVDCFRRVLTVHPEDGSAALYEAKALVKLGDAQSARRVLEASLTHAPGQLESRALLARLDAQAGDRTGAEDQWEAVLLLDPANHDALLGLAQQLVAAKRFSDVVELLEPQANRAAAAADLTLLLMQGYEGLGRHADAEKLRRTLPASSRLGP